MQRCHVDTRYIKSSSNLEPLLDKEQGAHVGVQPWQHPINNGKRKAIKKIKSITVGSPYLETRGLVSRRPCLGGHAFLGSKNRKR